MLTLDKKTTTPLTATEVEIKLLVKNLNTLLCNLQIHYQKLRSYHWNVSGSDFFDLHQFFEDEYNSVKVEIDDMAERIKAYGETPISQLQQYLDHSTIKETSPLIDSTLMVREILKDYKILSLLMSEILDATGDIGDKVTEDMVTGLMKRIEKRHWMLSAFIK